MSTWTIGKREYNRQFRRMQAHKGLCYACARPRARDSSGRRLCYCAYHQERTRQKHLRKYIRSPLKLFSLTAFVDLSSEDRCYLAGLLDGEGCFYFIRQGSGRRTYPLIQVQMTDKEPVLWLHTRFGGGLGKNIQRACRRPVWAWKASGRRAAAVAAVVLRHLQIPWKRKQAALVVKVGALAGRYGRWNKNAPGIQQMLGRLAQEAEELRSSRRWV